MPGKEKHQVIAFCGSTRQSSSNEKIIHLIASLWSDRLVVDIYPQLEKLPHFNPGISENEIPLIIQELRSKIASSDGVLISTPEYIFAAPAVLKNIIEWMVGVNVFVDKPVLLVVASGLGEKTLESMTLMLDTLSVRWNIQTRLLLQGARAKLNAHGDLSDQDTSSKLKAAVEEFISLMQSNHLLPE